MPRRRAEAIDRVIGANLRRLRIASGVTQQQLGKAIGVSLQQIQKYERGTSPITASSLLAVADVLGVAVERFWPKITL